MKRIFKVLLLSAAIIILGLELAFVLLYGPNFGIYLKKPSPEEYVQRAVRFMDSQGIYSATEEWRIVREETLREAAGIGSYEESYALLDRALKTAGGKHSRLIAPEEKAQESAAATAGYCSCNNVIRLYDGASMLLTMGADLARTGEKFCEDPIEPEELSDEPERSAAEWILGFDGQ